MKRKLVSWWQRSRWRHAAREWLSDLAYLSGAGLLAYGMYLLHPAAGFISGGLLLLWTGYLIHLGGNNNDFSGT